MTVVVDASVALCWLLDLPGSEKAFAAIQNNDRIIAPDLVLAEIANGSGRQRCSPAFPTPKPKQR